MLLWLKPIIGPLRKFSDKSYEATFFRLHINKVLEISIFIYK